MRPLEIELTRRLLSSIVRYFKRQGYRADYEVLDRSKIETREGVDAIAIIGEKVIGFQTKRPTDSGSYTLNKEQYEKVKSRSWLYYAFPENVSRKDFDTLLHRTIFSRGGFDFKDTIKFNDVSDGVRWGHIAKGIEECPIGLMVTDQEYLKLDADLKEMIAEFMAIFFINSEKQHVKLSVKNSRMIDKRVFRQKGDKTIDNLDRKGKCQKCPRCGWPE